MKNLGQILGSLLLAFTLVACDEASRNDAGVVVEGGDLDVFSMRVGDCFNDVDYESEIYDLPGVPCDEPHDNEVFAIYDTDLSSFPGEDEMSDIGFEDCLSYFKAFVGRDYQSSILDIFPIVPTLDSWTRADDREVSCALYEMNAKKLEGSMRDTGL